MIIKGGAQNWANGLNLENYTIVDCCRLLLTS